MRPSTIRKLLIVFDVVLLFAPTTIVLSRAVLDQIDFQRSTPKTHLTIDRPQDVLDVDVYCNDVYIGKTPATVILEENSLKTEALETIPQWTEPPRQERYYVETTQRETSLAIPGVGPSYITTRLTYNPLFFENPFKNIEDFWNDPNRHRALLKKARFWLRYEKDGCRGVDSLGLFYARFDYSLKGPHYHFTPRVVFESTKEHLRHLLFALRRTQYHPTENWLKHASEYLGLLYYPLRKEAEKDERIRDVLNAVISYRYGFSESMGEGDYWRIVEAILDRTVEKGYFEIPSPDSDALRFAASHALDAISEEFLKNADSITKIERQWKAFDASPYKRYQRDDPKGNRMLPLEYAIALYHPPRVFNRLVYEYTRNPSSSLIQIIANYPSLHATRLFDEYLKKFERSESVFITEPSFVFSHIHNSHLDNRIQTFLNHQTSNLVSDTNITKYYLSLIERPKANLNTIGSAITRLDLSVHKKLELLVRIEDREAYNHCQFLGLSEDRLTSLLLLQLRNHPNPYFEDFLVETYHWYVQSKTEKEIDWVMRALLLCNTEKTRELIIEIVKQNPNDRKRIVRMLDERPWFDPVLSGWTEYLSNLDGAELRVQAVEILARTDTDESRAILSEWANDPDETVRTAARAAIQECEEMQERTRKLLAGEMTPDEFLTPTEAHVWNGEDYVRESKGK